jgi:anti-anti-sigma regulatory factor
MNISVSQAQGRVPVTILSIQGDLDGSNYQDLIAKAKELYNAGTRHLVLDMTNVPFMSSAGIVALHNAALLMRGDQPPDPEQGWAAYHAVARDRDGSGLQQHVKLLNPQPRVDRTLGIAGMKAFFEIHTDLATAIASF